MLDFDIFDFQQFGVPQTRRRILASHPDAVRRLRHLQKPALSVANVLALPVLKTGDSCAHIFHNGGYGNKNLSLRSVFGPSFTITTTALYWASPDAPRFLKMTPREMASLQTFRDSFVLPDCKARAYLGVGNAIPPEAAHCCVSASLECSRLSERNVSMLEARVASLEVQLRFARSKDVSLDQSR